jgi:hypothetical protein
MAHPVTHENLVMYSCCFGIGIAIGIGIGIGFSVHRIPIAIPIPIPNGVDCWLIFEADPVVSPPYFTVPLLAGGFLCQPELFVDTANSFISIAPVNH